MSLAGEYVTPRVGMEVASLSRGSIYTIEQVEDERIRLVPKWSGMGSRSLWKTRARLWYDYRVYLGGA